MWTKLILCTTLVLITLLGINAYDRTIVSARIESCRGCSLNRLPEVKQFIYKDVPQYENIVFEHIQGAPPELVLLSGAGEEINRLPLSKLTRLECNELLEHHGFRKSENKDTEKTEF